ncbi:MAG: hypothetical protein WDM91_14435 [Rhizomicrobium sp.]
MTILRSRAHLRALTVLLCAAPFSAALADAPSPAAPLQIIQQAATNKNLFTFDYGIPTSPALALVGTTNAISSPSAALKPFVFSVPASWGGSKDSQAFSFDFSAMWGLEQLGSAQTDTYQQYIDGHFWEQLPYRTRLQGALFMGDDGGGSPAKAKASRLAFGFSASLFGQSDPLTATDAKGGYVWSDCVDGVFDGTAMNQYKVAFNGDNDVMAYNFFSRTSDRVENATDNPGVAAAVADGYAALDDCLKPGQVCARFDADKAIQKAVDAKDLPGALQAMRALDPKVRAAIDTSAETLSKKFGIATALDACVTKANAAARLGADLDIGGGVVWSGTPGKVENFTDTSGVIWISGRLPIGVFDPGVTSAKNLGSDTTSLMLGGALRAGFAEDVSTGVTATPLFKANVFDAWVGVERYSASTRFAAQIGYMDTEATDAAFKTFSKSGTRWLVSASVRADKLFGGLLNGTFFANGTSDPPQNGVWVNATYGASGGTVTTLDDKTIMLSLSYSPSDPYKLFGDD